MIQTDRDWDQDGWGLKEVGIGAVICMQIPGMSPGIVSRDG